MVKGEHDFINYFKTPEPGEYMPVEGKYDMPKLKGIRLKHPEKPLKIVGFNEAYKIPVKQRKNYIVEFFLADYLFERVWSRLEVTTEFLKQFKMVMSPDFSQYLDMPKAMLVWQQYRRMFVSWYWQRHGIVVLPVTSWSDEWTYHYTWDGFPHNSCVVVSSVCCWQDDCEAEKKNLSSDVVTKSLFRQGTEKMIEVLTPTQIIWYGKIPDWAKRLTKQKEIELIHVKPHYCERFHHD